ncbi:MAG: FtsX-like permease family protein [Pedobacter sp.]|nr:MAG: FtsX-like permease family protein [Pedobacter sp.]
MFRLNLKIALRNLFKNKVYATINILGLAIGLTSCLLLLLYANYEWGYDKQFKSSEHIYQALVNLKDANGNVSRTINQTQNVLLKTLKEDYSEVEAGSRITDPYKMLVSNGDNALKLTNRYVDPDFLELFDFQFISGNPQRALSDPNSIVLTASSAMKIFGRTDVINQSIRFENLADLKVTAVVKDLPANITFGFEMITPWTLYENLNEWPKRENWGSHNYNTLLRLNENADVEQLNAKMKGVVTKHLPLAKEDVFVYPLTKLHLYGEFSNGKSDGGKIEQVQLFFALAFGILLIACINFLNLSTANTGGRAKEIGVKKTMGASKSSLVKQFMLETFLLTFLAIVLSIILLELSLPVFNNLLEINVAFDYSDPVNWILVSFVFIVTSFLAGSYPAFYLSAFKIVDSLKKSLNFRSGYSLTFRQALVVAQFSFSIILILASLTIYKQIQFIKNRPLGYESNGLVEVAHEGLLYTKFDILKSKLLASGAVVGVTQSSGSISNKNSSIGGLSWEGMNEEDKVVDFDQIFTTYDFLQTTGVNLVAGREFNRQFASDTAAILLSNKAVEVMKLKQPIGAKILHQGVNRTVVGVFDDIVWASPTRSNAPMVIAFADISDVITMRLNPTKNISESIALLSKIVKEVNPNFPVDLKFIDQLNSEKFKSEKILGTLANVSCFLAIVVSCLGLFGLASFTTVKRVKEIGIRKILGASVREIMQLLSLGFVKLIFLSACISLPIAYLIMSKWLGDYEIRSSLSWDLFALTIFIIFSFALLTVSWQTYRAAKADPVKSLKQE